MPNKYASSDDKDPALLKLGAAVRRLRTERKLSQEKLALESAVHVSYIASIERAENNPTILTLVKVAQALAIPVEKLIAEAGL